MRVARQRATEPANTEYRATRRAGTWIVIAAYNEGTSVRAVVAELVSLGWRVVVVDDGSRDDTFKQANNETPHVLRHVLNLGQGAALQTGVDYALSAGAEAIVTFDADGQHNAADAASLVDALEGADVALGSRFLGRTQGATRRRRVMLRLSVMVSNFLSGTHFTDAHCGLRAFRASAAPNLHITQARMAHASQLLKKIATSGLRVVEIPVTVRYTEYSMAKGQSFLQAIRILLDYMVRR